MATAGKSKSSQAPMIVSLEDDLKGFFQSSPPAPVDVAVIFNNFLRLGKTHAACAALLSWESPDPIGLGALEKVMARFDSLVMAAPLSRGAVPGVMPPAFRRGSVAETSVHGDLADMPLVNRIPIPGLVLDGENAMAGFSVLESETTGKPPNLLARWEDRVVLSFPLLTVIQRLKISLDQVEIRLGECIRLGSQGAVIPIDRYGRFTQAVKNQPAFAKITAESIIDIDPAAFPADAPDPLILRDDQSAAEPATRAFSKTLSSLIAALGSDSGLTPAQTFPRLGMNWEIGILATLVAALGLISRLAGFSRYVGFVVLSMVCLIAQWLGVGMASVWLPGLPALAIIATAVVILNLIPKPMHTPAASIEILPAPEPAMVTINPIAIKEKKVPVAKKAPPKKTAKKAAPKKSPPPKGPTKK